MAPVDLYLRRGPGVAYAVLAAVLVVFLALGVQSWLRDGKIVAAVVATVVGLAVVAFLTLLAVSILAPRLTASGSGVVGRIDWSTTVDVGWDAISIDVVEDAPGQLLLRLGADEVVVTQRSWLGFGDFVRLVASTPAASRRLSLAARPEVIRLLGSSTSG